MVIRHAAGLPIAKPTAGRRSWLSARPAWISRPDRCGGSSAAAATDSSSALPLADEPPRAHAGADVRVQAAAQHDRPEDRPAATNGSGRTAWRATPAPSPASTMPDHEVGMAMGQQERDGAAHRVADGDHRADAELADQRGGVVGEWPRG